jgi:membrane associated rhomboid family serine protease
MIPLGDVVPRRTRPVVTWLLSALIVGSIAIWHGVLDAETRLRGVWAVGAWPDTIPWPAVATSWLIEPLWLAGVANIAGLLLFGPAVEDRLGPTRFVLLLVVTAGVTLWVTSATFRPPGLPTAGAAALVASVLSAYLLLFPRSKLAFWTPGPRGGALHEPPILWSAAAWTLLVPGNLARYAQGPALAPPSRAAVGAAFVIGVIWAWALVPAERRRVEWWDIEESTPSASGG